MWAQLLNIAMGLWLMAAPQVMNYDRPAATSDWVVGPLVAQFACVALWDCTHGVRLANVPLGLWLIVAPLLLDFPAEAAFNSILCGGAVTALSFVRRKPRHRYAGGWAALWSDQTNPLNLNESAGQQS